MHGKRGEERVREGKRGEERRRLKSSKTFAKHSPKAFVENILYYASNKGQEYAKLPSVNKEAPSR